MALVRKSLSQATPREGDAQVDFPKPEVPAIIRNEDGSPRDDGLIPRTAVDANLQVIVPEWTGPPSLPHTLDISWRSPGGPFVSANQVVFPPPVPPGDKSIVVPTSLLRHGSYELSYMITIGGNTSDESLKLFVTVDREAPNDNQRPLAVVFPDELSGVISEDYLTDHGEVRTRVPRYTGRTAQDRAVYYWTDTDLPPDSETPISEQEFSQDDIDNDRFIITFDAADIRSSGSGSRYVYYYLRDLAGNVGPRSWLSPIRVDLTPLPGNLQPPRIPLSGRGLIDREHAREGATDQGGVTVEIDAYDNPSDTQKILINWDGTDLGEHPVDTSKWPQVIYVPWSTLTAKGLGPFNVPVNYRVSQAASWTLPSPSSTVPVNLTVAGQDHPNAPALLNTGLAKLEIRGVSNLPNQLTGLDEGFDATAFLELFDDPQPSQRIDVFWGSVMTAAAVYIVKPGDVAGQQVPITVPWTVIEQDKNNRTLPVFYITNNGVNQQQSRVTEVDVSVVVVEDLTAPKFPHAYPLTGFLDCCSRPRLWEGVTVKIEGDITHFNAGDTIELTWQGDASLNGSNPIAGAREVFTKQLTAVEAEHGFDIVVLPYDRLIAPMVNNGSAVAQYRLLKTNGGVGRSKIGLVKINRTQPSGEVCSPDNDLCTTN